MEIQTPVAAPAATPPPAPSAPPTRGQAVADLIAKAESGLFGKPDDAGKPVEGAAAGQTDATPAATPPLPSTPQAPATEAVIAAEESASALIRLKIEIIDSKKELQAQRAAWMKEQADARTRTEAMERAYAEWERDPAGFAQSHGGKRSPMDLARDLYIESADIEKLPAEHQAGIKAERELMRLRRAQEKMAAELAQTQNEHRLAMYRSQLSAGMMSLDDKTPLVRSLAASNPQLLLHQLESLAGDIAVKRPDLGPQSTLQLALILEPQIAEQLEATHTQFADFFKRKYGAAPPPSVAAAAAAAAPAKHAAPAAPVPSKAEAGITRDMTSVTPARSGKLSVSERIEMAAKALDGRA